MESPERGSGSFDSTGEGAQQSSLIPGLPDDLAICCLASVPRKAHARLKCVSKRWRDLVCGHEWLGYRQRCGLQEKWIYAFCADVSGRLFCFVLDPSAKKKCWRPIRLFDDALDRSDGIGFEVIGSKIYVLGGCHCNLIDDSSNEVYCFDTLTNERSRVASLTTARCYFACETLNGKIHAIGGTNPPLSGARSCEIYDPRTMSWTSVSNPDIFSYINDSTVMDGKIYICGQHQISVDSPNRVAVYEPSSNIWQNVDSDLESGLRRGNAVVADGNLYVLDYMSGTELIMWNKESREWVPLGRLSTLLTIPPSRLVAIGRTIYVTKSCGRTLIVDLDKIENQEGVVVCSSISHLELRIIVLSCKCVVI